MNGITYEPGPLASAPFAVPPSPYSMEITELDISTEISFADQITKHVKLYYRLGDLYKETEDRKSAAGDDDAEYRSADEDLINIEKALLRYAAAREKASQLVIDGYRLKGKYLTKSGEQPIEADADLASMFYVHHNDSIDSNVESSASNENTCEVLLENAVCMDNFIEWIKGKPLDVVNKPVAKLREFILRGDQGEISKLMRDPLKRPLVIIQNIRDKLLGGDNGEIAKVLRDPIKCTVGKLFGQCR